MTGKFLCVLAHYDEGAELRLKELQKILLDKGFVGKQTPNLPFHITLGSYNISEEGILKERLKNVRNHFKSFDIRLSNIGLFGLDVLFIAPAVNNELLDLHQYFKLNYSDNLTWTPHTTTLIDDNEIIQMALPLVANSFQSCTGRIESISLYEFWPTRFIVEEKQL